MEYKLNLKKALLLSAAVAVLVILAMVYKAVNTEAVHIEINGSVAISANRLGNVINRYAFNDEGEQEIRLSDIGGKRYPDALELILSKGIRDGYFEHGDKISVKIWVEKNSVNDRYKIIERNVKESAAAASLVAHCSEIDKGIERTAEEYGISVGKYRMICELQKMDPSIRIDVYKDYSLKMLKGIYDMMRSGASKDQAENASGVQTGRIRDIINKILFESSKGE